MFCLQEEEDKKRPKRSATSTKTTRSKKARQATSDEEEDDDSNDSEYEVCQAIVFVNRLDDKSFISLNRPPRGAVLHAPT